MTIIQMHTLIHFLARVLLPWQRIQLNRPWRTWILAVETVVGNVSLQKKKDLSLIKNPASCWPLRKNDQYILDRNVAEAGPSEPQREKMMPPIVAKFKTVTDKKIKMLQGCTKNEIRFEYVRGGLKIRTASPADHKAATSKLKHFMYNPTPGQNVKYIVEGPPPNMTCEEVISGLVRQGVAISHCRQLKRTTTMNLI